MLRCYIFQAYLIIGEEIMQHSKTILGCGAVMFLASANVFANCQGPANEVTDCSFEAIPIDTSWTVSPGVITRDTMNFTGGVAAGRIDTDDIGGGAFCQQPDQ